MKFVTARQPVPSLIAAPPVPMTGAPGLRDLPADIASQLPERGTA